MQLNDVFKNILDGSSMLFVGAGISFLSKNSSGASLPNGAELSALLHSELGLQLGAYSLDKVSSYFKHKKGAPLLVEKLKEHLLVSHVSPSLTEFYQNDWQRIYTTNYDDAIEFSRKGGRQPAPLVLDDEPSKASLGVSIHLNGYIHKIEGYNLDDKALLTDRSYAEDNLRKSGWLNFLLGDMRACRSIVFLGYSLADLDIERLIVSDPAIARKTIFIVSPDLDEFERSLMSDYGTVVDLGFDGFYCKLKEFSRDYVPSAIGAHVFYSLVEIGKEEAKNKIPAATRLFNQLVYGEADIKSLMNGDIAFGDNPYLVDREQINEVIAQVEKGECRDLVLTGGFACGKTFACMQLAKFYFRSGYRVFWVSGSRKLSQDLSSISRLNDKVCLIVDGYRNHIDDLKSYAAGRPKEHVMVLSERVGVHELLGGALEGVVDWQHTNEVTLDKLSSREIASFDLFLDFCGLWDAKAGWSKEARRRFIEETLDGSLYKILVEVVSSEKVRKQIEEMLAPLREDDDCLRFFITAFVVNVLKYDFMINDWQRFYRIKDINKVIRKNADGVGHFVMSDSYKIQMRSGVASAHMLRNFSDNKTIADCLFDLYRQAKTEAYRDELSRQMCVDLMKYNTIEPLFADQNKLNSMTHYYDEIRTVDDTASNSDYWLQFGIACTVHKSLEKAGRAFATAYAKENARRKPNLIKIDNYFARYEMEKAISSDDPNEAFTTFLQASNRLFKQIFLRNNRHYPFKTGRAFADIASKHYDLWDEQQKKSFITQAKRIYDKALEWKRNNKGEPPHVNFLISEIGKILSRLDD